MRCPERACGSPSSDRRRRESRGILPANRRSYLQGVSLKPNTAASAAFFAERPGPKSQQRRTSRLGADSSGRVAPQKTLRLRLCSVWATGPLLPLSQFQNWYFRPSWKILAGPALVILPKFPLLMVPVGAFRFTLLNTLKVSNRNMTA